MKTFFVILLILSLELWLCATHPDEITRAIGVMQTIFFWLIFALLVLGPILAFIACLLSPPPNNPPASPPVTPPPPIQRDTLTPLLLGLVLGWWLGGGPGDGGHDC